MEKYFITIVDNKTMTVQYFICYDDDLNGRIEKELGGWGNLRSASTSDRTIDDTNYQQCGTTKDGRKSYSILCVIDNN